MTGTTARVGAEQMAELARLLREDGFPIDEVEDETDGEGTWSEERQAWVAPVIRTIEWGNWTLYDDGMLYVADDQFPANDCDLVAFIESIHRFWHRIGGDVIKG